MSWIAVGIGVGTAALGAYTKNEQNKAQARAQKANLEANAEMMRYSPWSGMKTGLMTQEATPGMSDAIGSGLQSGLKGYQFGKQFDKKPAMAPGAENPDQAALEKMRNAYFNKQNMLPPG